MRQLTTLPTSLPLFLTPYCNDRRCIRHHSISYESNITLLEITGSCSVCQRCRMFPASASCHSTPTHAELWVIDKLPWTTISILLHSPDTSQRLVSMLLLGRCTLDFSVFLILSIAFLLSYFHGLFVGLVRRPRVFFFLHLFHHHGRGVVSFAS